LWLICECSSCSVWQTNCFFPLKDILEVIFMVQILRDCLQSSQSPKHHSIFFLWHPLIRWKRIQATVRSTELLRFEINIRCVALSFHRLFCFCNCFPFLLFLYCILAFLFFCFFVSRFNPLFFL
jgi:hypothetical protein